jgi:hypothetical protein
MNQTLTEDQLAHYRDLLGVKPGATKDDIYRAWDRIRDGYNAVSDPNSYAEIVAARRALLGMAPEAPTHLGRLFVKKAEGAISESLIGKPLPAGYHPERGFYHQYFSDYRGNSPK